MFYTIYKITNKINNKEYIGKHQTTNIDDGYMGSGKHLKRALTKYGVENFTKEILFSFSTESEMNLKEAEIVTEEYCASENTYNICPGGKGGWGYVNKNCILDRRSSGRKGGQKNKGKKSPSSSQLFKKLHEQGLIKYKKKVELSNEQIRDMLINEFNGNKAALGRKIGITPAAIRKRLKNASLV